MSKWQVIRRAAMLLLAASGTALAQQELPLYAGEIPNSIVAPDEEATRDPDEHYVFRQNISRPTLTVYLPQQPDARRAAIIILPGGIPTELIVYPAGGHGFGLNNATTADRWIDRCRQWLASQGWIAGERPASDE